MKIAFIEPVGGHGGQDYYDFGLCRTLGQLGNEVTLYTCDETEAPSENSRFRIKRTYRKIYGNDHSIVRGLRYIWASSVSIMSARYENTQICHFYYFNIGLLELFNVSLAKLLGMKVIITANDIEPFIALLTNPYIERLTYWLADGVITHNGVSKNELQRIIGLEPDKVHVVPHGNYIDSIINRYTQQEARRAIGLPVHAKILLFFGRLKGEKGVDVLFESFIRIAQVIPDAVLVVAGTIRKSDLEKHPELITVIEGLKRTENVISRIGFISKEEVDAYYAAADIVILPYKKVYLSGVLLMAMSHGKAVIASDLDAMKEVIIDNENGFLFKRDDAAALADKIVYALGTPELLERISNKAFKLMQEEYNWENVGKLMQRYYAQIVGGNQPS